MLFRFITIPAGAYACYVIVLEGYRNQLAGIDRNKAIEIIYKKLSYNEPESEPIYVSTKLKTVCVFYISS